MDHPKVMVNAFIMLRFDYCNSLYCGLPKQEIDKPRRAQYCVALLVSGIRRSNACHERLAPANIGARIDFKILHLHNLAPYYLSSLLVKYQPVRSLHSSNGFFLQVPPVNAVSYAFRSFSYYAPKICNSLPNHIKYSESVPKQRLKTFLFN